MSRPESTTRNDLRSSLVDGGAFSLMVGIGETYLPAFVLALGHGEVLAGLISSVPLLLGALLQLVTPWGVRKLGSHRRWVLVCATTQALSLVPFVVAALSGSFSAWWIFAFAAIYWGSGQAAAPAWNTWIERLVPRPVRPTFFARRSRLQQICVFVGLLAGGLGLDAGARHGQPLFAFAITFALAATFRATSVRFLAKKSEPAVCPKSHQPVSPLAFFRRLGTTSDGRLVLYMLALQGAVNVGAPFFTPFMLRELHLSYAEFMALTATSLGARVVALPLLGVWARRFGSQWLLWLGGVGVAPLAALWLVSSSFSYLVFAQILSGIAWAAYELATQLLFFEMVKRDERVSVLTLYNVANATAVVTGALVGGAMLGLLGQDRSAYLVVFGVSSLLRAASVVLLLRVARVPRQWVDFAWRILAVRPGGGAVARPVLASYDDGPTKRAKSAPADELAPKKAS